LGCCRLFVDADKMINVRQIETWHPVIGVGDKLMINYSKSEDFRGHLNLIAIRIRGEVVEQFWFRPVDDMVELNFTGGGEVGNMTKCAGRFVIFFTD